MYDIQHICFIHEIQLELRNADCHPAKLSEHVYSNL